jgi:hypothetical protein
MGTFNEHINPQGYNLGGSPVNENPFFEFEGGGGGGLSPENITINGSGEYSDAITEPDLEVQKNTTEDSATFNLKVKIPTSKSETDRTFYDGVGLDANSLIEHLKAEIDAKGQDMGVSEFSGYIDGDPNLTTSQANQMLSLFSALNSKLSYTCVGRKFPSNSILSYRVNATTLDDETVSTNFIQSMLTVPQGIYNGVLKLSYPYEEASYMNYDLVIQYSGCKCYPDIISSAIKGNVEQMTIRLQGDYYEDNAYEEPYDIPVMNLRKLTIQIIDNGVVGGYDGLTSDSTAVLGGQAVKIETVTHDDVFDPPLDYSHQTQNLERATDIITLMHMVTGGESITEAGIYSANYFGGGV